MASGEDRNIAAIIVVLLILTASYMLYTRSGGVKYEAVVAGVKVSSEIPLEELKEKHYIALYNTTKIREELTCKFELSALAESHINGYLVKFEAGPQQVYLKKNEALISAGNGAELLASCHAFSCMLSGINCPDDFNKLKWIIDASPDVALILEEQAGASAGRGFAELEGVLSYIQASKVDVNNDGILSQSEVDANTFFIYPYIKSGEDGLCRLQSFHNVVQSTDSSNKSIDCSIIEPAIILEVADYNSISSDGLKIIIRGDGKGLYAGSIIVRDVIAPEWVRRIYGFN
ncbi:MAG TPA: hypothetical protein ENN13_04560 [Candidatus Altiarchaeales archaeon]|nr:hypothetical protein [Candidatus Altiarchaeales archaeon]